jgi:hypothetical protein
VREDARLLSSVQNEETLHAATARAAARDAAATAAAKRA